MALFAKCIKNITEDRAVPLIVGNMYQIKIINFNVCELGGMCYSNQSFDTPFNVLKVVKRCVDGLPYFVTKISDDGTYYDIYGWRDKQLANMFRTTEDFGLVPEKPTDDKKKRIMDAIEMMLNETGELQSIYAQLAIKLIEPYT